MTRQQRRKQERDQKKAMKKTMKQMNAGFNLEDFQPDAGLNSPVGEVSHYWLNTTEFTQVLVHQSENKTRLRSYGTDSVVLNLAVDIMDKDGNNHLVAQPKNGKGHMLSVAMTPENIRSLAKEIDKGGMSVRISGKPAKVTMGATGEPFKIVEFEDCWSAGNDVGSMSHMFMMNGSMYNVSSKDSFKCLNLLADSVDKQKVA
jgi:hypothetical protein